MTPSLLNNSESSRSGVGLMCGPLVGNSISFPAISFLECDWALLQVATQPQKSKRQTLTHWVEMHVATSEATPGCENFLTNQRPEVTYSFMHRITLTAESVTTNENVCSLQTQPMKTFVVSGSELEVRRLSTVCLRPF